jgi:hypothetical protein
MIRSESRFINPVFRGCCRNLRLEFGNANLHVAAERMAFPGASRKTSAIYATRLRQNLVGSFGGGLAPPAAGGFAVSAFLTMTMFSR